MPPRRARTWIAKIVMWCVRLFFAVILGFPFYWMLITTFKRNTDLNNLQNNPFIYNERPTLDHLKLLFHETMFPRWVLNTAFAGLVVVIITLLLAVPAAYALARLTGNWGAQLGIGIFLTYLIPPPSGRSSSSTPALRSRSRHGCSWASSSPSQRTSTTPPWSTASRAGAPS